VAQRLGKKENKSVHKTFAKREKFNNLLLEYTANQGGKSQEEGEHQNGNSNPKCNSLEKEKKWPEEEGKSNTTEKTPHTKRATFGQTTQHVRGNAKEKGRAAGSAPKKGQGTKKRGESVLGNRRRRHNASP